MMGIVSESGAWNLRVLFHSLAARPASVSPSQVHSAVEFDVQSAGESRRSQLSHFPLEVPLGTRGVGGQAEDAQTRRETPLAPRLALTC